MLDAHCSNSMVRVVKRINLDVDAIWIREDERNMRIWISQHRMVPTRSHQQIADEMKVPLWMEDECGK